MYNCYNRDVRADISDLWELAWQSGLFAREREVAHLARSELLRQVGLSARDLVARCLGVRTDAKIP